MLYLPGKITQCPIFLVKRLEVEELMIELTDSDGPWVSLESVLFA